MVSYRLVIWFTNAQLWIISLCDSVGVYLYKQPALSKFHWYIYNKYWNKTQVDNNTCNSSSMVNELTRIAWFLEASSAAGRSYRYFLIHAGISASSRYHDHLPKGTPPWRPAWAHQLLRQKLQCIGGYSRWPDEETRRRCPYTVCTKIQQQQQQQSNEEEHILMTGTWSYGIRKPPTLTRSSRSICTDLIFRLATSCCNRSIKQEWKRQQNERNEKKLWAFAFKIAYENVEVLGLAMDVGEVGQKVLRLLCKKTRQKRGWDFAHINQSESRKKPAGGEGGLAFVGGEIQVLHSRSLQREGRRRGRMSFGSNIMAGREKANGGGKNRPFWRELSIEQSGHRCPDNHSGKIRFRVLPHPFPCLFFHV